MNDYGSLKGTVAKSSLPISLPNNHRDA